MSANNAIYINKKTFKVYHHSCCDNPFIEKEADLIGKGKNLEDAIKKALRKIRGSYALGIMSLDEPDKIVAVRHDSPLVIGLGRQENFIVSDVSAI